MPSFTHKNAHGIIDLGAGDKGGYAITEETPREVAQMEHSYTGQYLRPVPIIKK